MTLPAARSATRLIPALAAAAALTLLPLVVSAAAPPGDMGALEVYTLPADAAQIEQLRSEGFDVLEVHDPDSPTINLVMSPAERARVEAKGLQPVLWQHPSGKTAGQLADAQQQGGFAVWRSWDEVGGIRDELYQLAREHPDLIKLEVLGTSVQDREIIALKVTKGAQTLPDGQRPAVLYSALQHAREWIALEVNRRLLHHFLDNYGKDPLITNLIDTQELWFILCANPDGYQRTFTEGQRLWRKNTRDNNGDGQIMNGDGVDPNRNYPGHWGYDNEGSSPNFGSETFRGAGPASEPETQAMIGLWARVPFVFQVNYHSVASLILYPVGWQMKTHAADHPILSALAGDIDKPAIPGFRPQVSADLYITNGELCDSAYERHDIMCYTPELSDQGSRGGFVFPDDEALVQKEFQENLPFAMDIAQSASHPTQPVSHLGNTVQLMYPDVFTVSHGDPQVVQVNAQRDLGDIALKFQIGAGPTMTGPTMTAPTTEWEGGERYGAAGDVHYRILRGEVRGAKPGDQVRVWFEARGIDDPIATAPFTYTLASDTDAPALVVAAEDYSGATPAYPRTDADGPRYAQTYLKALEAAGLQVDLYDVDGRGRLAPSPRGVLGHYKLVVLYTGEDLLTRAKETDPISRLPLDMELAVRDFLNEGGKLLFAGNHAGYQTALGSLYHARPDKPCSPTDNTQRQGCENFYNDFMQYYLGANGFLLQQGMRRARELLPVSGSAPDQVNGLPGILSKLALSFNPLRATQPMTMTATPYMVDPSYGMIYYPTSNALPAAQFPQFRSRYAARYDRPGETPHDGLRYVTASGGTAINSYRRLMQTVNLTNTTTADLGFWVSRRDWPEWGHVFVEAHTTGQDDWTTLPDKNGHTRPVASPMCGLYPNAWLQRHPHLAHYLTLNVSSTLPSCLPEGTSGAWHAATGGSDGWEEWKVDLSAWAGKQVQVSLSTLAGYRTGGAYYDDIAIRGDNVTVITGTLATSFESGQLDGWRSGGSPPGSPNAGGGLQVTTGDIGMGAPAGGPVILTEDTVLMTFGLENLASADQRTQVMQRVVDYLLAKPTVYLPAAYHGHTQP